MEFVIKTPAGFVTGFSKEHQVVQVTVNKESARKFTKRTAGTFIERYADAGYGLRTLTAEIVPAGIDRKSMIKLVILDTIGDGEASWPIIRMEISKNMNIDNWLTEVRGPLQELINEGKIEKLPSLVAEEYRKVKNARSTRRTERASIIHNIGWRMLDIDLTPTGVTVNDPIDNVTIHKLQLSNALLTAFEAGCRFDK